MGSVAPHRPPLIQAVVCGVEEEVAEALVLFASFPADEEEENSEHEGEDDDQGIRVAHRDALL